MPRIVNECLIECENRLVRQNPVIQLRRLDWILYFGRFSELKRQNFFRVHGQYAMADFLSWILPWVLILLWQGFKALKTSFLFFFPSCLLEYIFYPYVQVMVNLFKYYSIISQQTK